MLTGYNTDVSCEGKVFHVQTEDRGTANPVLETLVYCGGQILHHERSGYEDLVAEDGTVDEKELARRLERQHRDVLRRVRHGAFLDPPGSLERMVGEEGELDELVARALERDDRPVEPLAIAFEGDAASGLKGSVRVSRADGSPAAEVRVQVRIVAPGRDPLDLVEGRTDGEGRLVIAAALPDLPPNAAAILRAQTEGAEGRMRLALAEVEATMATG
ncbi:MAG: hypothetical protein D6718_01060 [Acidobacteria bacterium]|nr:MAG: hypothetical protein D6718_01060 [Acidobacteriota bacterium]